MISRKYNIINNAGGWLVFLIALVCYWLTLEPTASYWDCGEFIIQADKLEVGHPPGNPIFMLTARFFANFATSPQSVSLMVNAMSGLLSALTILLLFWTITHLVRRLVVRDGQRKEPSLQQYLAIMGSGLVGALAYAWSDTFWFSAVEGEVYAFSSFCTALTFWLILKWENRADQPHSDRYLILIAYIIGVSIAVHLLNLLCIPAVVLVFCYRKFKDMSLVSSLVALLVSFAIVVLVLFGLVPGFMKVAQQFELWFVNGMGLCFNSGAGFYVFVMLAAFAWALFELNVQKSRIRIIVSVVLATALSGMLFLGSGVWLGLILLAALAAWMLFGCKSGLPVRVLNVAMWSMAVIFVGYSSYALILIRSTADTPMNQNSPDNVFDLAAYMSREQYGETPLLYGATLYSGIQKELKGFNRESLGNYQGEEIYLSQPVYSQVVEKGKPLYVKGVPGTAPRSEYGFLSYEDSVKTAALAARGKDYYAKRDYKTEPSMNPELNMLFPRIHSRLHVDSYKAWVSLDTLPENMKTLMAIDSETGQEVPELNTGAEPVLGGMNTLVYPEKMGYKPTWKQNLGFFLDYQLNHMYLRYFMWNFAGRQNDIQNMNGELDAGNWISGIPFIDNARLGDQSQLPDDLGKNNRGHNVFYMLPLLLGLIGLLWQAFAGKRGIEQFWVVFFLFFMTGIAIVLYLNQTPLQTRERDYAYAGSFYAYAIWIGMGVAALWRILLWLVSPKKANKNAAEEEQPEAIVNEPESRRRPSLYCAAVACVIGIAVPLQMVSQTWDDHDRSGRYAARDYAANYLESLEPNAIVFCNGDNDTFPLWYVQEVEGVRPDVKIVNLSYLASDWYANQIRQTSYTAPPVKLTARPEDYAYAKRDVTLVPTDNSAPVNMLDAIRQVYADYGISQYGYPTFPSSVLYIPVDKKKVIARGLVAEADSAKIVDRIEVNLNNVPSIRSKGYVSLSELLMYDIIATNAAEGWPRPIYWCQTVGDEYHAGLTPYVRSTGMTHQIVPTVQEFKNPRTDRSYNVVTNKYVWGGADVKKGAYVPYFDETAGRMLSATRSSMLETANELYDEGEALREAGKQAAAMDKFRRAAKVIRLIESKTPESVKPYELQTVPVLADLFCRLGAKERLNDPALRARGLAILKAQLIRYAQYVRYQQAMSISFGPNARLTYESQTVPYKYYQLIELYQENGGNVKALMKLPEMRGINLEESKKLWDALNSLGNTADGNPEAYMQDFKLMARTIVDLAKLSPEEYARTSDTERYYDSLFYQLVEQSGEFGLSPEAVKADPDVKAVDMVRAKRLYDEYARKHPELTGN